MIFGIIKKYKDIKNGAKDPAGFGQGVALDFVKIPLTIFTITGVVSLGLLFLLGFTEVLTGPFSFFRFLFWFLLVPFVLLEVFFWSLFRKFKKLIQKAKNRVDERVNTIDVEVK